MASKGQISSPHLRHPLPSPGMVHHDPFVSAYRPPPGGFPPFDLLPPPEIMEQRLSAQHIEIEKLIKENRRLASTHGTLRQDLAMANNELHSIHAHIAEVKSETEQQTRGIMDKMAMMEAELKAAEAIKLELQQARGEAEKLFGARQELILKVQQLTRDLHLAHSDAQQIPTLMSELDSLRREYEHSRATYDHEKKLYSDHLESLQVMEQNYMAMSREVDKLRAELTNFANFDPRTGAPPYIGYPGYGANYPAGNYASGQNVYATAPQSQIPHLVAGTGGPAAVGIAPHAVTQSVPAAPEASKIPDYNSASLGTGYNPHRVHTGTGYGAQTIHTGANYNAQMVQSGSSYDAQRGQTGSAYDPQRGQTGPGYDAQKGPTGQNGTGYDPSSNTGYVGPQGQVPLMNTHYAPAHASSTPSTGAGSGYQSQSQSQSQGGNPVRK